MEGKKTQKIPTGSSVLDHLLDGGFDQEIITTIYGPSSTGKTCLCLQAMLAIAKGKKVIYIDTEGGFSPERVQQIEEGNGVWDKIILLSPTTFEEQNTMITQLASGVNDRVGLIVVDSIAMLYRLEMHKAEDVQFVNRKLGIQLAALTEITRKHHIPVIITNQVYARFDDRDTIRMVGGDLLKYSSKCLIELQKDGTKRKAILHKHRSLPEGKEIFFEIRQHGVAIIAN